MHKSVQIKIRSFLPFSPNHVTFHNNFRLIFLHSERSSTGEEWGITSKFCTSQGLYCKDGNRGEFSDRDSFWWYVNWVVCTKICSSNQGNFRCTSLDGSMFTSWGDQSRWIWWKRGYCYRKISYSQPTISLFRFCTLILQPTLW